MSGNRLSLHNDPWRGPAYYVRRGTLSGSRLSLDSEISVQNLTIQHSRLLYSILCTELVCAAFPVQHLLCSIFCTTLPVKYYMYIAVFIMSCTAVPVQLLHSLFCTAASSVQHVLYVLLKTCPVKHCFVQYVHVRINCV